MRAGKSVYEELTDLLAMPGTQRWLAGVELSMAVHAKVAREIAQPDRTALDSPNSNG